jgi:uncharacterized membrane protein
MSTNRLEAFSDGVIAILITIMVLEMKVPHGTDWSVLRPVLPVFLSYVLSFIYLGIYWMNHHHMLHVTKTVKGGVLWANTNLLFWLSLIPFVTGWMGENDFAALPMALYGVVLLASAFAYWILQHCIIAAEGEHSVLKEAVGDDWKGKTSLGLYAIAIASCLLHPAIAGAIYILVAIMWLVPDPRIERMLADHRASARHST